MNTQTCIKKYEKELAKLESEKRSGKIKTGYYKFVQPMLKRSIKRCSMTLSKQKANIKAEFARGIKSFRKTFKKSK